MYSIYCIQNKQNDKVYIGQSINVKARFLSHKCSLNRGTHRNGHLQRAWNSYGKGSFEFYVIFHDLTSKEADEMEASIIRWYKDLGQCYNLESGGVANKQHSEETKEKIRQARSRQIMSPKPRTEEQKERMREAQRNRTPEHKENFNKAMRGNSFRKGIPCSEETKEKLRQSNVGKKHVFNKIN